MNQYREGQRVRIEWPNGSAVEGVLTAPRYGGSPSVAVPRAGGEVTLWQPGASVNDGRVVTILSEPRPEEPTGLGAVVEASSETYRGSRRKYILGYTESGGIRWRSKLGGTDWDELIDPVVLSEGWTP